MRSLTNLFTASIQRKMFFSFAVVIVLVLTMVIGGYFQLSQVRTSAEQVIPATSQIGALQDFGLGISALDADLERFFVIGGGQFREDIRQDQERIITALESLKESSGENQRPAIENLEQATLGLGNQIGLLLATEATDFNSREINERIIAVYSQIDYIKGLHQELSATTLSQLQDRAFRQATITSNVIVQFSVLGVLAAFIVVGASFVITRNIAIPLAGLARTAKRITEGDLEAEVPVVKQRDEVGQLATAFGDMTTQLREMIGSLEQRVADRTHRLKTVASLSERLNAILDFDDLLDELVNRVKTSFDYYHAHVYIIDETQRNLVMTAGAGEAGVQMKAAGHHIPLDAPTSLVAQAARSGEIVWVDNVRQAEGWLPNPLLPDTFSEMAVPIVLEGEVVGVLDVQEDEIAGLDEGDANLLRSLSSQVAVAIRNARLFAEVDTALADARISQERYLEEVWNRTRFSTQAGTYLYTRPGVTPLAETIQQGAKQQALQQKKPTLISAGNGQSGSDVESQPGQSMVAPVKLGGRTIGTLQLHQLAQDEPGTSAWSEDELALVGAVLEQVAQTAENLRLVEETQEQANYERTVGEITDKLRAAPSLNALLEVASRELGQRLGVPYTVLEMGIDSDRKIDLSES